MRLRQSRRARHPGEGMWMTLNVLALAVGLTAPTAAIAQDASRPPGSDPFWERWKLRVSGYLPTSNTSLRFDAADGRIGTELDFEDDLGIDERKFLPAFDLSYRFNERHRIEGSYFSIGRDGTQDLEIDIDFGDTEFSRDTQVDSFFDTDIYRVSYSYSFVNEPNAEFGFLAGLHLVDVDMGIATAVGNIRREPSLTLPLPVIGLHGGYAFSPRVSLNGRGQVFALEVGRYSGVLFDLFASLQYDFSPHLGLALGYQLYDANGSVQGEDVDFEGEMDFVYYGPTLSAIARF